MAPTKNVSDEERLRERIRRRKVGRAGSRTDTVLVAQDPGEGACGWCRAVSGEPCISMVTGKALDTYHAARQQPYKSVPRFEKGSNKLSRAGVEAEHSLFHGIVKVSPLDRLRYDPPEDRIISGEGGWVTFLGQTCNISSGGYNHLNPGDTYYARHAPETLDGYDRHGQFKVIIQTKDGPAWLFPYEYAVLSPTHLWALVREGELEFVARDMSGKEFGERVHYVQSRGIPLEQAVLMCLGDIKDDIGYFLANKGRDAQWWRFQAAGLPLDVRLKIQEELLSLTQ